MTGNNIDVKKTSSPGQLLYDGKLHAATKSDTASGPLLLGVGGLSRANPRFGVGGAEEWIRRPNTFCCTEIGPKEVPLHWFDGGFGWVTNYFTDVTPFNVSTQAAGTYKCQVLKEDGTRCNHEIQEGDSCKGSRCCWRAGNTAYMEMLDHAMSAHGAEPPPLRPWSTGLFDSTEGCLDACLCSPCQGSRQMMALSGWEDTPHCGWCLFFSLFGLRSGCGDVYLIPPQMYVALFTRCHVMSLNHIDENCFKSLAVILFCPVCSAAQTYRELSAAGVWPGSSCGQSRPSIYPKILAPDSTSVMV